MNPNDMFMSAYVSALIMTGDIKRAKQVHDDYEEQREEIDNERD